MTTITALQQAARSGGVLLNMPGGAVDGVKPHMPKILNQLKRIFPRFKNVHLVDWADDAPKGFKGVQIPTGSSVKPGIPVVGNHTTGRVFMDKMEEAASIPAIPKTVRMQDVYDAMARRGVKIPSVADATAEMKNQVGPQFLIKPIGGAGSAGVGFVSDKDTILQIPKRWQSSHIVQQRHDLTDEPRLVKWLQSKLPESMQGFGTGKQEWRVHTVDGKVVPGATVRRGSTVSSFNPFLGVGGRRAERAAQSALDGIKDPELRRHAYGFDVAKTRDGRFIPLEANPADSGGASGLVTSNPLVMDGMVAAAQGRTPIATHAKRLASAATALGAGAMAVPERAPTAWEKLQQRMGLKTAEASEPLYDWDGTIIPHLPGGARDYTSGLAALKREQLSPLALNLGDRPIDIATARPPMFHPAILAHAKRLGINVRSIAHADGDKVEHVRATGRPIIDNSHDVVRAVSAALGPAMAIPVATHEIGKLAEAVGAQIEKMRERRGSCPFCGAMLAEGRPYECRLCDAQWLGSAKTAALVIQKKKRMREETYQDCPSCGVEWGEKGGPWPKPGDADVYVCPHCDAELEYPELTDDELDTFGSGFREVFKKQRDDRRARKSKTAAQAAVNWRPCRECGGEMRDHAPDAPPGQRFRGSVMCQQCGWTTAGTFWRAEPAKTAALRHDKLQRLRARRGECGECGTPLTKGCAHSSKMSVDEMLKRAAAVDVSDLSDAAAVRDATDTAPTQAQRDAGNYEKARVRLHGLDIAIENPKGTVRSGVSKKGVKWSVRMKSHYGYILGTTGADGDHVDVFIGPDPTSEIVFIIEQNKPGTDTFDETKCVIGCKTEAEAKALYHTNYSAGWKGFRAIHPATLDQFKWWLANADHSKPIPHRGMFAFHKKAVTMHTKLAAPVIPFPPTQAGRAVVRLRRLLSRIGTGIDNMAPEKRPKTWAAGGLLAAGGLVHSAGESAKADMRRRLPEAIAALAVPGLVAGSAAGAAMAGLGKRNKEGDEPKVAFMTKLVPMSIVRDSKVVASLLADCANDPETQKVGMLKYAEPVANMGMFFTQPGPFWMLKMAYDLDIAFANKSGDIVDIQQMKMASADDPGSAYRLYESRTPGAVCALEMPAGWFSSNAVRVGDTMQFSR